MKDILKYQFGIEKEFEFKKEGRKIYLFENNELTAVLNPKFGLFTVFKNFGKYLLESKKFIKVKSSDFEFIKKSKNIFKCNVIEIGDFGIFEDVAIMDEKNKIIGIGKTRISSEEFYNSKKGIVAKIRL